MDRRQSFWNLLLAASFMAAVVSLFTTALGLQRYLSILLAWPLAVAVQVGLFGLAWLIALGRGGFRQLVVGLYLLTMPFSVVFSYVMLQSELTSRTRPIEAQRSLLDDLRRRSAEVAGELQRGLTTSEDLMLRLDAWLELERSEGWTTGTCAANDHPYLAGVCGRIRDKIAAWERTSDRPYRQGPGERLIYGLLETEREVLENLHRTLAELRGSWQERSAVFAPDLGNRQRLERFDAALAAVPRSELEAVLGEPPRLPVAPAYEAFARDAAETEERPLYAFEDLTRAFDRGRPLTRADFPTLFALGLAIFIDLFVLLVAVGAGVLAQSPRTTADHQPAMPPQLGAPREWGEGLQREIGRWIDGALLEPGGSQEHRHGFLGGVLDAVTFDGAGQAVLVAEDLPQRRFGHLLVSASAARAVDSPSSKPSFRLHDWVFPALSRYLTVG